MKSEDIVGKVTHIETIAEGSRIRELLRLRRVHGEGRWKKKKGLAHVRLPGGEIIYAEVHWYEAHGIGKVEYKIKHPVHDE
jgi:hypothetical protein